MMTSDSEEAEIARQALEEGNDITATINTDTPSPEDLLSCRESSDNDTVPCRESLDNDDVPRRESLDNDAVPCRESSDALTRRESAESTEGPESMNKAIEEAVNEDLGIEELDAVVKSLAQYSSKGFSDDDDDEFLNCNLPEKPVIRDPDDELDNKSVTSADEVLAELNSVLDTNDKVVESTSKLTNLPQKPSIEDNSGIEDPKSPEADDVLEISEKEIIIPEIPENNVISPENDDTPPKTPEMEISEVTNSKTESISPKNPDTSKNLEIKDCALKNPEKEVPEENMKSPDALKYPEAMDVPPKTPEMRETDSDTGHKLKHTDTDESSERVKVKKKSNKKGRSEGRDSEDESSDVEKSRKHKDKKKSRSEGRDSEDESSDVEKSRKHKDKKKSKSEGRDSEDESSDVEKSRKHKDKKKSKSEGRDSEDESSDVEKSRKHKDKKKSKSEGRDSEDEFSDIERSRKHKEKKKKSKDRDKKKGIKMKIKLPSKKDKSRKHVSQSSSEDETCKVVSLNITTSSTASSSVASLPPSLPVKIIQLTEDGLPCQWLVNEVHAMLREKKIQLASALDDALDQLTGKSIVWLKRWNAYEIAEATRRRKPYEVPSNYIPPKTKFNRNELMNTDVSKLDHKKRKLESEEGESSKKKMRNEESERKKHKKSKHKKSKHLIDSDEEVEKKRRESTEDDSKSKHKKSKHLIDSDEEVEKKRKDSTEDDSKSKQKKNKAIIESDEDSGSKRRKSTEVSGIQKLEHKKNKNVIEDSVDDKTEVLETEIVDMESTKVVEAISESMLQLRDIVNKAVIEHFIPSPKTSEKPEDAIQSCVNKESENFEANATERARSISPVNTERKRSKSRSRSRSVENKSPAVSRKSSVERKSISPSVDQSSKASAEEKKSKSRSPSSDRSRKLSIDEKKAKSRSPSLSRSPEREKARSRSRSKDSVKSRSSSSSSSSSHSSKSSRQSASKIVKKKVPAQKKSSRESSPEIQKPNRKKSPVSKKSVPNKIPPSQRKEPMIKKNKRIIAQHPIPIAKPAPSFKIPKKANIEKPVLKEISIIDDTKPEIKKMPTSRKRLTQTRPQTEVKISIAEKSIQTDPFSGLKDGPSIEDLMLLARSQINDNPILLLQWARNPPVSYDNLVRIQSDMKCLRSHDKPKISLDAYKKKQADYRNQDTRNRDHRNNNNPDSRRSLDMMANNQEVSSGFGQNFRNARNVDQNQRNMGPDSRQDQNQRNVGPGYRNMDQNQRNLEQNSRNIGPNSRYQDRNLGPDCVDQNTRYAGPDTRNVDQNQRNMDQNQRNMGPDSNNMDQNQRNMGPDSRNVDQNQRNMGSDSRNMDQNQRNIGPDSRNVDQNQRNIGPDSRITDRNSRNMDQRNRDSRNLDQNPRNSRNTDKRHQDVEAKSGSSKTQDSRGADRDFRGPDRDSRGPDRESRGQNRDSRHSDSREHSSDTKHHSQESRDRSKESKREESNDAIKELKNENQDLKKYIANLKAQVSKKSAKDVSYEDKSDSEDDSYSPRDAVHTPSSSEESPKQIAEAWKPPQKISVPETKVPQPVPAPVLAPVPAPVPAPVQANAETVALLALNLVNPFTQPIIAGKTPLEILQASQAIAKSPLIQGSPVGPHQSAGKSPMGMSPLASLLGQPPPPPPPTKKEEDDDAISLYFTDNLSVGTINERSSFLFPSANNPFVQKEAKSHTPPPSTSATVEPPKVVSEDPNSWIATTSGSGSPFHTAKTPVNYNSPTYVSQQQQQQILLLKQQELLALQKKQEQMLMLKRQQEEEALRLQQLSQQNQMMEVNGGRAQPPQGERETNDEAFFRSMLTEEQPIPQNFLYRPCYRHLQGQGGCTQRNCNFNHDIPEIDLIMEPMMPIEAMQIFLFVRKKQYRVFYSLAFQQLVEKLTKYCEVRLLLLLSYELMHRENDVKPRWWYQIIQSLLQVGDNITDNNEIEIRKVLIYILNRSECTLAMRTDIARLSLRAFQFMPEVLHEVFKDRNYVPPKEIISILIEHLLLNKTESWAGQGIEVLVTPISEVVWRTFRPDTIEEIASLCSNTVKQVLYKKAGKNLSSQALLLPPPLPPQSLLVMEMEVDNEDSRSPAEDPSAALVTSKRPPQASVLMQLQDGQEQPELVKTMYHSMLAAIEEQNWSECFECVKKFGREKLPRGRCLYNALKEKLLKPHLGFERIVLSIKSSFNPSRGRTLPEFFRVLFGTVGVNLLLDLIDQDKLQDACSLYRIITNDFHMAFDNVTSYRELPITHSLVLLKCTKMMFKLNFVSEGNEILREHSKLNSSDDQHDAIEVLELLVANKVYQKQYQEALTLWKSAQEMKLKICAKYNLNYEPPKHSNDLLVALMGAKMFQIAELVWKKVRDFPQCLERRTIRSFLIQLFDKRRDLAKDAYQAGKLNNAYPVQLYNYRPYTIRMRSFWTIEEMMIVIEDYLDRLDTPLTADLLEFSVALNIEEMDFPPPSPNSMHQAMIPLIDCKAVAAIKRAEHSLKLLEPPIILNQPSGDFRLLTINNVSMRYYLKTRRELYRR